MDKRYILRTSGTQVELIDADKTSVLWVGPEVSAIGLTRSELEELKDLVDEALQKP